MLVCVCDISSSAIIAAALSLSLAHSVLFTSEKEALEWLTHAQTHTRIHALSMNRFFSLDETYIIVHVIFSKSLPPTTLA